MMNYSINRKLSFYEIEKTFRRADLRKIFYMFRWKLTGQTHPRQFDENHPCVFVLSTGRVGSETLTHLLKQSDNALVYHEPLPELFGLSRKAYELYPAYSQDETIQGLLHEAFLTSRRALFEYALYCNRGYIEAGPPATFLAPIIRDAVPQVKFIHLIRSPLAVVQSGMRRGWYSGHPYDATRIIPDPASEMNNHWDSFNAFEKNCWLWAETNRWIADYLAGLPADQSLTFHSEDLFGADNIAFERLFSFINQPVPITRSVRKILGRKLNAQNGSSMADINPGGEVREPLRSFFEQTAARFGYEL